MVWDQAERRRRGARYRLILRGSVAALAIAGIVMTGGVALAVQAERFELLGYGVFLASLSLLAAYLAVNRTAKIVEMDERDRDRDIDGNGRVAAFREQHSRRRG